MMVTLSIIGYIILIGYVMISEEEYMVNLNNLRKKGIDIKIKLPTDGYVEIIAIKRFGNTIRHAKIIADDLLEAILKLIKYIDENIEDWIEQELY